MSVCILVKGYKLSPKDDVEYFSGYSEEELKGLIDFLRDRYKGHILKINRDYEWLETSLYISDNYISLSDGDSFDKIILDEDDFDKTELTQYITQEFDVNVSEYKVYVDYYDFDRGYEIY